jgi:hypothetical protein
VRTRITKAVTGVVAAAMLGLVGVATVSLPPLHRPTPTDETKLAEAYGDLPLRFEANVGQVDTAADFVARSSGGTVFLSGTEAVLTAPAARPSGTDQPRPVGGDVVRMRAIGADPSVRAVPGDRLAGVTNYLTGNDPAAWKTGVPSYGSVRYPAVYPGIDQVFHGHGSALEYDFVVAPGADPGVIALGFDGPTSISLDRTTGDLVLRTPSGHVRQPKPTLYQEVAGARRMVTGGFTVAGDRVGFRVGSYDRTLPR